MMLSFGRVIAAAIALAERAIGDELVAARIVTQDTNGLPKRMRQTLRGKIPDDDLKLMSAALDKLKVIAVERHHMVHGEWWFNVFENGQLEIRNIRPDSIEGITITADAILRHAHDLEEIADLLDDVDFRLRRSLGE
jgi:hypothetical protein